MAEQQIDPQLLMAPPAVKTLEHDNTTTAHTTDDDQPSSTAMIATDVPDMAQTVKQDEVPFIEQTIEQEEVLGIVQTKNQGECNQVQVKDDPGAKRSLEDAAIVQDAKRSKLRDDVHPLQPRLGPYHPSFDKALRLISETTRAFTSMARAHVYSLGASGDTILNACKKIEAQGNVADYFPAAGPVACFGPTGVGKSSTINSILQHGDLAITNDGISRGTWVVHEYSSPHRDSYGGFYVVVKVHSAPIIELHIRKHLKIIDAYFKWVNEEASEDERADCDLTEDQEQKHKTSVEFFHALLCGDQRFRTFDSVKNFVEENIKTMYEDMRKYPEAAENSFAVTDREPGALGIIHNIIRQFLLDEGCSRDQICQQVYDVNHLAGVYQKYSRPRGIMNTTTMPSLWPLVDKIVIHHDSHLLESGLVLADTPGFNDSNAIVVENTERCLSRAAEILVFAPYQRILDSSDLNKMLQKCISLGREHDTYLVVTRMDERQPYTETSSLGLLSDDRTRVLDAIKKIDLLKKNVSDVTKERDIAATDVETAVRFRALELRRQSLDTEVAQAERDLKTLSVQIECGMIREKLGRRLRDLSRNKTAPFLKVFFVSNSEYKNHKNGQSATLDIEATGIPDLIRHLYSIPASGKLEVLSSFGLNRLPRALGSIAGILGKPPLERKQEVEDFLSHILRDSNPEGPMRRIDDLGSRIIKAYQDDIWAPIQQNPQWASEACDKVSRWATICSSSTFKTFCKRNGHWRLADHQPVNWNFELQSISQPALESGFDKFVDEIETLFQNALKDDFFKGLRDQVDDCDASQGVSMTDFWALVDEVKYDFVAKVNDILQSLGREIYKQRRQWITGNEAILIELVMYQAYDECVISVSSKKRQRRPGQRTSITGRRAKLLQDHISGLNKGKNIFMQVGDEALANVIVWVKATQRKLERAFATAREQILESFKSHFQCSTTTTGTDDPDAKAAIILAAEKALGVIEGPVKVFIEECKRYEDGESIGVADEQITNVE